MTIAPQDYDYYEYIGDVERETDKAWLLEVKTKNGTGKTFRGWFPKKHCQLTTCDEQDLVCVPTWLAKQKGICYLRVPAIKRSEQRGARGGAPWRGDGDE